jgi:hypothetical protein
VVKFLNPQASRTFDADWRNIPKRKGLPGKHRLDGEAMLMTTADYIAIGVLIVLLLWAGASYFL